MITTTFGDTARQHVLTHNIQRLKTEMSALTQEMASGAARDPARIVQGNMQHLASIERDIAQSGARLGVLSLVATRLDAQQSALGTAQEDVQKIADTLLRPELFATDDRLTPMAKMVAQGFSTVVGVLNAQAGGRSLFAGQAVDRPALASAQSMLAELSSLIPVGADKPLIDQIVGDWFAPGGGFDATGYLGGAPDPVLHDLGNGTGLRIAVTAADEPMRQTLVTLAKGALMADDMTDLSAQTRRSILTAVGADSRKNATSLLLVIEDVGIAQARTEQATSRQQAVQVAANMARTDLLGADPSETATKLQDTISRVDQMFALTARLSRLSLSAYL